MQKSVWVVAMVFVSVAIAGAADIAPTNAALNLARNGDFEDPLDAEGQMPAEWSVFATKTHGMGLTTKIHETGAQSVRIKCQGVANAFQGLVQQLEVVGGEKYTFCADVRDDPAGPLSNGAWAQFVIEWINAQGKEIGRNGSPEWGNISKLKWTALCMEKVKAPKEAVSARFGIHLHDGKRAGQGALLVDNVVIRQE